MSVSNCNATLGHDVALEFFFHKAHWTSKELECVGGLGPLTVIDKAMLFSLPSGVLHARIVT